MRGMVKVFVVGTLGLAVLFGSPAVGLALEPGAPKPKAAPGGVLTPQGPAVAPGVTYAKACNGTCQCTGKDCTPTWQKTNCKDKPVCTSAGADTSTLVCSCVNKSPK